MRLPIRVHRARSGPEEIRVIRPASPPTRTVLVDHDRHLHVYLDQAGARLLGGLWLLAARSARSLIHLPLRGGPRPAAHGEPGRRLDLVLLHHSRQFRPSRWRRVRAKLDTGLPQTASLPEAARLGEVAVDHAARHHRENRDRFRQRIHAETLFLIGSAPVFRETAGRFLDVAEHGPRHASTHPGRPGLRTAFHSTDGTLADGREIHVEYCAEWEPSGSTG
ncbi:MULTISPECIES: hypothetical protein [Actinoalloteichus]|uniref:Uncharacterized protein n=1 Tax=Actinoalloteichus fjordicus TaxID=1612552 RepID=A0AAC9PQL0_9PSEU|nr:MULTISPECIES: hypothetical protein [Actinoalloteichus]APU13249.1 hypothetical protein UA74_05875 [Actinoalloteichus fjordicus]APU19200.1 hypothetical protein UA75_05880 [Actinoalloteichus sp. GBA129-24]